MVIVWLLFADELPQASTASQVLVTVLKQEFPEEISGLIICTVAPLQASLAVGAVKEGEAVHSIVASAPALPMVGACVSTSVMD
jgi:hypothetical protein